MGSAVATPAYLNMSVARHFCNVSENFDLPLTLEDPTLGDDRMQNGGAC